MRERIGKGGEKEGREKKGKEGRRRSGRGGGRKGKVSDHKLQEAPVVYSLHNCSYSNSKWGWYLGPVKHHCFTANIANNIKLGLQPILIAMSAWGFAVCSSRSLTPFHSFHSRSSALLRKCGPSH